MDGSFDKLNQKNKTRDMEHTYVLIFLYLILSSKTKVVGHSPEEDNENNCKMMIID